MEWTMPRAVVKTVAALLALIAIAALVMGVLGAPERGRLPGQDQAASIGGPSAPPMEAAEATPLDDERIEGPPPPKELTPEEKAKLEEEKAVKAEADAAKAEAAKAEESKAAIAAKPNTAPAAGSGDRVGDLLDGVTPLPAEEPPH